MPLEETFSLTPINSYYSQPGAWADINVYGTRFLPRYSGLTRASFDHQHANDELRFGKYGAADPALDYSTFENCRIAPHVLCSYNLSSMGEHKELALVFKYEAVEESRILIFTSAGLLEDVTLIPTDDQFLMEVESLDRLDLYFIHSRFPNSNSGGNWYFKGITGYVV